MMSKHTKTQGTENLAPNSVACDVFGKRANWYTYRGSSIYCFWISLGFRNYLNVSRTWKNPVATKTGPHTSQAVHFTNAHVPPMRRQPPTPRTTPRGNANATPARTGLNSYAAAVGNMLIISQVERS